MLGEGPVAALGGPVGEGPVAALGGPALVREGPALEEGGSGPGPGRRRRGPGPGLKTVATQMFSQTTSIFQYFAAYITFKTVNMLFKMVGKNVRMLKISSIDWAETGRRTKPTRMRTSWSERRLNGEVLIFRNNIHFLIWIHFNTLDRGSTILGWATRISFLVSKPLASSSLYKMVLCFLNLTRTGLATTIFF